MKEEKLYRWVKATIDNIPQTEEWIAYRQPNPTGWRYGKKTREGLLRIMEYTTGIELMQELPSPSSLTSCEKEPLSKEEDYSELREDLKIYQSLYEQSQSRLSQMTQRCEAAEYLIAPNAAQDLKEAYDKWQSLKSSQQTETKSTE